MKPLVKSSKNEKSGKSTSLRAQWEKLSKKKTVKFGDARVAAVPISFAEYKRNVLEGQRALGRGLKALLSPGVKLDLPPDVPRYHADSELCVIGCLVRVLKGKSERGTFKNERFYPWSEAKIARMRKQLQKQQKDRAT